MRGLPRARGAIIARPSPAATCLPRETRFGSPRGGAPGEINEFCVACHRFPGQNFAVNWNAQWNVRRQPPYLQRSRCFLESQGRLTCFSCHNPHAALQKGDAGYYTRKCLECHSKDCHQPAAACRRQTSGGCVGCHMPAAPVTTHPTFVNHWIGVYRNGENLKPETRVRPKPSGRPGG